MKARLITRFLIICLLPFVSVAQKIALIDTKFSQPIIFTDSVTVEQIKNYIPVGVENFDTLYADLNYIKEMLSKRQRAKMKSFELRAGNTILKIKRIPFSYGDRYLTTANTKFNEVESTYVLTDFNLSNSHNTSKINKIMAYMKNNKELFKHPYEVVPKIYNIVTITE